MRFSFLLLLFLGISCGQKEAKNSVLLNKNDGLLATEKVSLTADVSFNPPSSWSKMDDTTIARLEQSLYNSSNKIIVGYQDPQKESFLLSLSNPTNDLKRDSADVENGKWLAIQYSAFNHNYLTFNQTVLQDKSLVVFKLNIGKGVWKAPEGAIHFFMNRSKIDSQAKLVESCIASINANNN